MVHTNSHIHIALCHGNWRKWENQKTHVSVQVYSQLKSGLTLTDKGWVGSDCCRGGSWGLYGEKKLCSIPQKTISSIYWSFGHISFVGKQRIFMTGWLTGESLRRSELTPHLGFTPLALTWCPIEEREWLHIWDHLWRKSWSGRGVREEGVPYFSGNGCIPFLYLHDLSARCTSGHH